MPLLTIIVPCYRNAANVHEAFERLRAMEADLIQGTRVEYIFVDDGSDDGTHAALKDVRSAHPERTVVIKLTRNVGVFNAVMSAFAHAKGDCITMFPPDLQEPVHLIPRMFAHWHSGIPVVMTVRMGRNDALAERLGSWVFHRIMRMMVAGQLPQGGYGTALLDRRVMEDLLRMGEKNSNTLLLLSWLGYPYAVVPYVREKRRRGRSGWSFTGKVKFFVDSIVAFSYFPVRAITLVGILLGLLTLGHAAAVLASALFDGVEVRGWSTLMMVVLLTSSFQMIALGVLGEYLWRTLDSVRKRPPYIVEQILDERRNPSDLQEFR